MPFASRSLQYLLNKGQVGYLVPMPRVRAAIAAPGLLFCLAAAAWAIVADPFYNTRLHPFTALQADLLSANHFQIRPDGSVVNPDGQPLRESDMPYLLTRLQSAQRLKALLQLDILLNRSGGEKRLPLAEKNEVKKILRENWPHFTWSMRKHFSGYFTLRELEPLNKNLPPDHNESPLTMKDPEIIFAPQAAEPPFTGPVAPPVAAAPAAVVATAVPAPAIPLAEPKPPISVAAVAPAPSPLAAPKDAGVLKPWIAADVAVAAAVPAAAPPGAAVPVSASTLPPAPPAPAPAKAEPAAALPPSFAILAARETPLREILREEFDKFLADAPYGRDVKALLLLISEKAPNFARAHALNAVISGLPLIVVDSSRAGASARGALLTQENSSGEKSYTIAMSPGPLLYKRKSLFFGSATMLLSDSPQVYSALHVPFPKLEGAKRDGLALKQQDGAWGQARIYSDGSERGSYSQQQQAGSLLRELLLLDAKRQGWDVSAYAAELFAATAQTLLYARFYLELKNDRFLDPELRANFRQWLQRPAEYRDFLVHSLSSGRLGILDARKGGPESQLQFNQEAWVSCPQSLAQDKSAALAAQQDVLNKQALSLWRMGLLESKELEEARKALQGDWLSVKAADISAESCVKYWQSQSDGLKQASALLAQMTLAEQKFREEAGLNGANN